MTVSIILVVYKTIDWIVECLESIFGQSFKDYELIIISNDDDPRMDKQIRKKIKRKKNVRYILNKTNVGGAEACNQGIQLAEGDYVFLMDSDDLLPKDAIYHLINTADASHADIVIGRGKIIRNGKIYNVDYRPDWISWERPLTVNSISEAPYLSFNPYYWGRLYKRSMLVNNNIFLLKGAINADRNFNCRALIAASSISVTPQNTYLWRKHVLSEGKKSITQSRAQRNNFIDRVRMMELTDAEFKKTGIEDLYQYSRISGLMRILILAKDTADDPEFNTLFLETVHDYLQSFPYEQISSCEFLSYRIKTLVYLIKSGHYTDFNKFIKGEIEVTKKTENNKVVYSYSDINVPIEFRTQNIFHIPVVTAERVESLPEGIVITGSAILPDNCEPDPAGISLNDANKQEACRIDIRESAIEGGILKFSALITNDTLKNLKKNRYHIVFYYVIHLRTGMTKMTDAAGDVFYLNIPVQEKLKKIRRYLNWK